MRRRGKWKKTNIIDTEKGEKWTEFPHAVTDRMDSVCFSLLRFRVSRSFGKAKNVLNNFLRQKEDSCLGWGSLINLEAGLPLLAVLIYRGLIAYASLFAFYLLLIICDVSSCLLSFANIFCIIIYYYTIYVVINRHRN